MADNICILGFKDVNNDGAAQFEEIYGDCKPENIEKTLADIYGLSRDDIQNIPAKEMENYTDVMEELCGNIKDMQDSVYTDQDESMLKRNIVIADKIRGNFGMSPFVEKMVQKQFLPEYDKNLEQFIVITNFRQFAVPRKHYPDEKDMKRLGQLCGKTEKDVENDLNNAEIIRKTGKNINTILLKRALEIAKDGGTSDFNKEYLAKTKYIAEITGIPVDPKEIEVIEQAEASAKAILNDPAKRKEYINRYIKVARDVVDNPKNYQVSMEFKDYAPKGGFWNERKIHDSAGKVIFSTIWFFHKECEARLDGCQFSPVMFIGDTLSLGFETPDMNELHDLMIRILTLDLERL